MAEFTGERIIPGEVDPDLWNEHVARYAFAARLARLKRVLDTGCGAGYGSAELARVALSVTGLDLAAEAIGEARARYTLPNLRLVQGDGNALPFRPGSFDLVVAFELIEHLDNWGGFLEEVRRVLAPSGQAILSTPNKLYYTASRGKSGPNPYHVHEFEFDEFRAELERVFPHVSFFLQNHVEGLVFQPVKTFSAAEARIESGGGGPGEAHFFLAVCALQPQTGAPTFVYLPRAANILREREQHIAALESELEALKGEQRSLLEAHRRQTEELEERNRWARSLDAEIERARAAIGALQGELEAMGRNYQAKAAELQAKCEELAKCVEALHRAEKTIEERTQWALNLKLEIQTLETQLSRFRASRWVRLGKSIGLGPEARDR